MSLRNPFAPSLSSWCRFWASTPSSRRRSPLMCRLQSCETSWPLISMACQQVRPGSWAPVQSAYWRGSKNPMTVSEPEVLLLVFVLSTKSAVYRLCFLPFAQTTKLTNSKGSQTCDNNLDLWSEKTTKTLGPKPQQNTDTKYQSPRRWRVPFFKMGIQPSNEMPNWNWWSHHVQPVLHKKDRAQLGY